MDDLTKTISSMLTENFDRAELDQFIIENVGIISDHLSDILFESELDDVESINEDDMNAYLNEALGRSLDEVQGNMYEGFLSAARDLAKSAVKRLREPVFGAKKPLPTAISAAKKTIVSRAARKTRNSTLAWRHFSSDASANNANIGKRRDYTIRHNKKTGQSVMTHKATGNVIIIHHNEDGSVNKDMKPRIRTAS